MSYINVYPSRINWENEPNISTPLNATNLNKTDYALYSIDQTLAGWDTSKANQSDLLLCVKSIDFDDETGVFVFTWQNGTTKTIDLNIEKIPVSFSMDANGVITMTTDDGTTYTADVGALIKTYTFTDSTTIDFTVTTDASGNKTITADIIDGSITGSKLQPNYLADCQTAATNSSNSANAAAGSKGDAEAWAVGTRGGVPVPSTDPAYNNNSYYWSQHGASNSLAGLTDTDITTPQDGQILGYNGSASKWENVTPTAGGGSKIEVTTAESSLHGKTVTITDGTTTLSETFDNSGKATFTGVTLTGTLTITASDGTSTATKTLSVPYFGNYSAVMSFFTATITATFPSNHGATCTCDGQTSSSSPHNFTVNSAGTYSVVCTLDGVSKTESVTITTDGETVSKTFEYGTINLTIGDDFRSQTITCVNGGTTITKTAPSSGNTMAFYPPTTGTWTISGTVSGTSYSTTATVSSLSTPVSASLESIPNGSTVTPTDDIQTWLKCAGITDKAYTTLSQVLGDTDTYVTLLGDSNACDYMARSTTWSTDICADADAMRLLGMYDYACYVLRANNTWNTAINNSSYASYIPASPTGQTDIIHSAPVDTIYYLDNGTPTTLCVTDANGIGTVDWSDFPVGDITLYSSVAKDPTDVTADYSKTIKVTKNKTEAWLMPDKALYWYGYKSSDFTLTSPVTVSGRTRYTPTYQTNAIYASTSGSTYLSIGTNTQKTDVNKIYMHINLSGSTNGYNALEISTSTTPYTGSYFPVTMGTNQVYGGDVTQHSGYITYVYSGHNTTAALSTCYVYALWYE